VNGSRRTVLALGAAMMVGACGVSQAQAQNRIAISAPWGIGPDGSLMKDVTVVIAGGRIERVLQGKADVKVDRTYRFETGVISPGLIDVGSTLGVVGDSVERKNSVDPDASIVDALDSFSSTLRDAGRAGVTAAMLAPAAASAMPGACATVRTIAPAGVDRVLRGDGPVAVTLGSGSWDQELGPSSRAGVLDGLRAALRDAKAAGGTSRLARMARGEMDVYVDTERAEDVAAATQLFARFGVAPTIRHSADLVETSAELAENGSVVVVGPYTFTSDVRLLAGPASLGKAGGEVAFCGGLPVLDAGALRVSAALAVRYGLDPAAARRGLTINAARVAGLGNRVGALTPGSDADIVVFSADPLRLDARVLEVWVAGKRVHVAESTTSDDEDGWKAW